MCAKSNLVGRTRRADQRTTEPAYNIYIYAFATHKSAPASGGRLAAGSFRAFADLARGASEFLDWTGGTAAEGGGGGNVRQPPTCCIRSRTDHILARTRWSRGGGWGGRTSHTLTHVSGRIYITMNN